VAYRQSLFWDGRAASLEDQVLGPLAQPAELGRDPAAVASDLNGIPEYVTLFEKAFPSDQPAVTVINMQRAIAAFERSLISDRAPYDHYVGGDEGALDDSAKHGMFLFASAGCATCHVPPLFDSNTFANRGIPGIPGVADDGRAEVTHMASDTGAFLVPTLRNIRESGPYFHTGAVDTLDDAVRHEALLSPMQLSDSDIGDLVTFLNKGLIDPSRSPIRPDTVPSGLPVPLDGFRIPR
jgi:cytochrome c peroxidase